MEIVEPEEEEEEEACWECECVTVRVTLQGNLSVIFIASLSRILIHFISFIGLLIFL